MRTIPLLAALIGTTVFAAGARAHSAHVHGQGTLNVSLQGDTLSIALESPLDNLLGFERKPKYAKDFEAVKAMAATLREADGLFSPTPAAQCALASVKLASGAIEPAMLGESASPSAAAGTKDEHADLDARFVFRCARPAELKGLEVKLFDAFKRFRVLQTQIVTDKRQSATRLTPKARTLSW